MAAEIGQGGQQRPGTRRASMRPRRMAAEIAIDAHEAILCLARLQ